MVYYNNRIPAVFRRFSELPTLCGQLARRPTAKLCHNQVHMTCGSHRTELN